MRVEQSVWSPATGWPQPPELAAAHLTLAFGNRATIADRTIAATLSSRWPGAAVVGCSTAGHIAGTDVLDEGVVATAIQFDRTEVRAFSAPTNAAHSDEAGAALGRQLSTRRGLVHVLVFSEGLDINGEALVRGLREQLPQGVSVTGGLSADGEEFRETLVLYGGEPRQHTVCAIGLYGDHLNVGYGSLGGWDPFGPERHITRAEGNVLYQLDGQSALALYKRYLGTFAKDLPASGLLFPLSLRTRDLSAPVVRTILAVNEADQSLTFAGDVPAGGYVRLMKANVDRLIDGAVGAGRISAEALGAPADLALLISCVGRRMVLRQRIEEEVEGVRDIVGPSAAITGFYSYGEISPFTPKARCELHNQTMTVTTLAER